MPNQADIGNTANLEEAVIDRVLELIHAIGLTPAQRKELLRQVALRLDQEHMDLEHHVTGLVRVPLTHSPTEDSWNVGQ